MKGLLIFAFTVAGLVGAATCSSRGSGPGKVTILYSADIAGFVEPCGCSKLQRGGLQRAALAIAQARQQGPTILVDGGDALFKDTQKPLAQDVERARTIAGILRDDFQVDAAGFGERDAMETPHAAALLDVGHGVGQPMRVVERGGVTVALVGAGKDAAVAAERIREARKKARVVIVLWHQGSWEAASKAQAALAEAGADVVLVSHADDLVDAGKNRALTTGPAPLFAVEGHGQSLLRLDIAVPAGARQGLKILAGEDQRKQELDTLDARMAAYQERIAADPVGPAAELLKEKLQELAARRALVANAPPPAPPADQGALAFTFIPLPLTAPEDPKIKDKVEAYQAAAAKMNLAQAAQMPEVCPTVPNEPSFTGGERCVSCHEEADTFWKGTKHAVALPTLVAAKRQFNLECVGCHVTGWKLPGGACRLDKVERMANVQCEACHGAGSAHSDDPDAPIARQVPAERCITCHDPHNSPEFDYPRYRKEILGPGHGMPLKPAPDAGPPKK